MEQIIKLINEGKINQALEEARKLPYPDRMLAEGIINFHTGNNRKSKELLKKYIKEKPDNPESYYYLGNIYLEEKNIEKAIRYLEKAVSLKQKADYYNDLGYAYFLKGDYKKAIDCYNRAIKIDPNLSVAYYNKALAYRKMGNIKEAIKNYSKAIALNPDDPDYYYNLGIAYRLNNEPQKAIHSYKKAIQLDPYNENYWNNLGNAYYDIGDYKKAVECYKKAVEINPSFFLGWQNLANTFLDIGEYEKAVKAFKKAIKIDKRCADCYMDMGIALKELGRYDEALKAYEKAVEIDPSQKAIFLYNKACLYASKGEIQKAKDLLKETFRLDPSLKEYAKSDPDVMELL